MNPIDKVNALPAIQEVVVQNKETSPSSKKEVREEEVEFQKKMDQLHEVIQENIVINNFELNFSVDKETGTVVVRIFDADTGKLIWEIPPAEILAIAKEIEKLKGILFNENI